tara:strand:+ start:1458 stop:1853 length:396 start_codon:yes stop_codon:yes gene_type:complete
VKTAAKLLCVSPETLKTWYRQGKVPYLKVGRRVLFREESLVSWAEEKEQGARPQEHPATVLMCGGCGSPLVDAPNGMWAGGYEIKCFSCGARGKLKGTWILSKAGLYERQLAVRAQDLCDAHRERTSEEEE